MKSILTALIVCLSWLAPAPVLAQASDIASERARLANDRSMAEAEMRARAEQERLERAAAEARVQQELQAEAMSRKVDEAPVDSGQTGREMPATGAAAQESSPRPGAAASGTTDISRSLEQLRTLGELRDAGYVTTEEFERIKSKILDSRF